MSTTSIAAPTGSRKPFPITAHGVAAELATTFHLSPRELHYWLGKIQRYGDARAEAASFATVEALVEPGSSPTDELPAEVAA